MIQSSELILNDDGSIYHLHLLPEHLAPVVITVGDPDRVASVSKHFDRIEHRLQKREFITHTGYIGDKRLSVISTGIGTDNIDIVFNELDALVNIDFATRQAKAQQQSLKIIRLGTSGSMRADIPVDQFLASFHSIGLDGLLHFYAQTPEYQAANQPLQAALERYLAANSLSFPLSWYPTSAGKALSQVFDRQDWHKGITLTASGFYAPQNRTLRIGSRYGELFQPLEGFDFEGLHITNLEMETSAMYGLGQLMGHEVLSLNAILANRRTGDFSKDPHAIVERLIETALGIIVSEIC